MPESSHGAVELDQRLAEIDRKLRAIQADLLPEREPRLDPEREPRPTLEPGSRPVRTVSPEPAGLPPPEAHARLLAAMRELLEAYGLTLTALSPEPTER